ADVWAGLVDHLLRELAQAGMPKEVLSKPLEELRLQRVRKLAETCRGYENAVRNRDSAEGAKDRAEKDVNDAKLELENARKQANEARNQALGTTILQDMKPGVEKAVKDVGLEPHIEAFGDLQRSLTNARDVLMSAQALLRAPTTRWLAIGV